MNDSIQSIIEEPENQARIKAQAGADKALRKLGKSMPGVRILTGWISVPGLEAGVYTRRFTHLPRSIVKDSKGTSYVIWHDQSLRSTRNVSNRWLARLMITAERSADPAARESAQRTLTALAKDLKKEKSTESAETTITNDAIKIAA